jgi:hypothetical protein
VIKEESSKDSPDAPKHKKIKIDAETTTDNMDSSDNNSAEIIRVKQEAVPDDNKSLRIVPIYVDENGRAHHEGTTAYTTNTRDKSNILIVKKDVKSLRSSDDSASCTLPPKTLCSHLVKYQPREPTSD